MTNTAAILVKDHEAKTEAILQGIAEDLGLSFCSCPDTGPGGATFSVLAEGSRNSSTAPSASRPLLFR